MELAGKRVAILAEDQYEDLKLWYPLIRMQEVGAEVTVVGMPGVEAHRGNHYLPVSVDATTSEVSADDFDAIIIPGGYAPDKVTEQPEALYLVWDLFERGGIVALSYHDGWVPFTAGMLKGRRVTSPRALRELLKDAGAEWVDEDVVRDGNLITARGTDELPAFCRAIVAALTDEAEEGLVPQATLHVESKPVVMR